MSMFIITLLVMLLIVAGMGIGALLANKPLKGSCGGLSALGLKEDCMICGGDSDQWQREAQIIGKSELAYDAMTEKQAGS
jgi:hypothetical protein